MEDIIIEQHVQSITASGCSIYDEITTSDIGLWIPTPSLEELLNNKLVGMSLDGLPIRTRSKIVKQHVCQALGYPVPKSFKKTQPRFPGQLLDIYIQKSNNLQIWNEEISISRRYAIVKVSLDNQVECVKVVTGDILAELDTTGKLTHKFQARLIVGSEPTELITKTDTKQLDSYIDLKKMVDNAILRERGANYNADKPTDPPSVQTLMPIETIFQMLCPLIGKTFPDVGYDQERNRGVMLQRLVCQTLGYSDFQDDGAFPDIRNQLIEIKLQTSPTIDLGLICPNSTEPLVISPLPSFPIRHCDVRYAVFNAETDGTKVTITNFYLVTGEILFEKFPQFQGNVINSKLQIPLPDNFFD